MYWVEIMRSAIYGNSLLIATVPGNGKILRLVNAVIMLTAKVGLAGYQAKVCAGFCILQR